jgi:hypothetical protein
MLFSCTYNGFYRRKTAETPQKDRKSNVYYPKGV